MEIEREKHNTMKKGDKKGNKVKYKKDRQEKLSQKGKWDKKEQTQSK